MPLYALDNDDLIHAPDAEAGKIYSCADCFCAVKKRSGTRRFPHFYHLKSPPSCRLYSKTEEHMLAQIQLRQLFPKGELQLEKSFPQIDRIADACWEKEKIVFEVQCSQLTEQEAKRRIQDYRSLGYETIWLLDDRRYNRPVARPAEIFLRKHAAYYISIRKGLASFYYDQFEIFQEKRRIQKGRPMAVSLQKVYRIQQKILSKEYFPKQIIDLNTSCYMKADRLYRAFHAQPLAMLQWRALEIQANALPKKLAWLGRMFQKYIALPYFHFLDRITYRN